MRPGKGGGDEKALSTDYGGSMRKTDREDLGGGRESSQEADWKGEKGRMRNEKRGE